MEGEVGRVEVVVAAADGMRSGRDASIRTEEEKRGNTASVLLSDARRHQKSDETRRDRSEKVGLQAKLITTSDEVRSGKASLTLRKPAEVYHRSFRPASCDDVASATAIDQTCERKRREATNKRLRRRGRTATIAAQ